jgi:hypothetical protein
MRTLPLRIALLAALASSALPLALAGPALGSPSQVISDCNSNGRLLGHYSRADLQSALNGMSADIREYTNCYDVINSALMSSAGSGAHSQSGTAAGRGPNASLPTHAATAAGSSLPAPLIVVLIVIALVAIGGGSQAIRTRVIARHGT